MGVCDSARSLAAWGHTVVIVARVPLIIADLALVYITWLKPLRSWEALIDIERTKGLSLSGVLFRNGACPCSSHLQLAMYATLALLSHIRTQAPYTLCEHVRYQ